mgnify:CR=1 FL=1
MILTMGGDSSGDGGKDKNNIGDYSDNHSLYNYSNNDNYNYNIFLYFIITITDLLVPT